MDATVVARLRAAGAVLLGKTNTPELTWSFETRSPVHGRTVNPWNPAMSPGGSSDGAAAMVAACASPFDVGSDTGGSIRVHAHFCGVAGIKPTSGRVPRTGHIIGAEGVAQVAQACARSLQRLGVVVEEARPEALQDVMSLDEDLFRADGGSWLRALLERAGTKDPGPDIAASLKIIAELNARAMTVPEFGTLLERWDAWRSRMLQFLARYDAILCPPCALDALPHDASDPPEAYPAFSYTFAYNMTGWPAAVVRAGTSAQGLPLGVQVIGRPWREDVVLALVRAIERSEGGFQAAPLGADVIHRASQAVAG